MKIKKKTSLVINAVQCRCKRNKKHAILFFQGYLLLKGMNSWHSLLSFHPVVHFWEQLMKGCETHSNGKTPFACKTLREMPATSLSNKEKAELALSFEKSGSVLQTWRSFCYKHGKNKPHCKSKPSLNSIRRWLRNLKETGSVNGGAAPSTTGRKVVSEENVNRVRDVMTANPRLSLREVSHNTGLCLSTTFKIARKKLKLFPYKIQIVQKLEPQDRPNRQAFAETLLQRLRADGDYLRKIAFSDEASFSVDRVVNRHNCRIWGSEHPHETFEKPRFSPKVQVWCCVHHSQIVGPYFFNDPTVTGANYLDMLQNYAMPQLERIPDLIYQQDGAPPHWSLDVRAYLDDVFQDAWIGRGGPTAWPARSPDITPLDFFLWGYVKDRVYKTPVDDIDHLKDKIREAVASVTPDMLAATWRELRSRLVFLRDHNGDHVEVFKH